MKPPTVIKIEHEGATGHFSKIERPKWHHLKRHDYRDYRSKDPSSSWKLGSGRVKSPGSHRFNGKNAAGTLHRDRVNVLSIFQHTL